jgi:sulfur carrier protein
MSEPKSDRGAVESALDPSGVEVTINGQARQVPDGLTVRGLIEHLGFGGGPVAVELNCAIVPRAEHPSRPVCSGDAIEIVHFVGA